MKRFFRITPESIQNIKKKFNVGLRKPILNEIKNRWPGHVLGLVGAFLIAWFTAQGVVSSVIAGHMSETIVVFQKEKINFFDNLQSDPIKYGDSGGYHAIVFCVNNKDIDGNLKSIEIKISYEISLDKIIWIEPLDDRPMADDLVEKSIVANKWYYKRQSLTPAKYVRYKIELRNKSMEYTPDNLTFDLMLYKYF